MASQSCSSLFLALILPFAAGADAPQIPPREPVHAKGTKILTAKTPLHSEGRASFFIDMSDMGLLEKYSILKSHHLAVIFNGPAEDAARTCPFFDLKTRDYRIIETEKNIFRIDAAVDESEFSNVTESACVVVTPPEWKKIEHLKRAP